MEATENEFHENEGHGASLQLPQSWARTASLQVEEWNAGEGGRERGNALPEFPSSFSSSVIARLLSLSFPFHLLPHLLLEFLSTHKMKLIRSLCGLTFEGGSLGTPAAETRMDERQTKMKGKREKKRGKENEGKREKGNGIVQLCTCACSSPHRLRREDIGRRRD